MKVRLYIFFFLVFFSGMSTVQAQKYLTFGQEYNFNVGDVFEVQYTSYSNKIGSGAACQYEIKVILSKRYSIFHDTIFYTDSVVDSPWLPCTISPDSSGSYSINSFYVSNLNSPSTDFNFFYGNNTCVVRDTLINSGLCNKKEWKMYPDRNNCNSMVYPQNISSAWVIEGCGGGYYYSQTSNDGAYNAYSLIYYKKGNDSCGSKVNIVTAVNELSLDDTKVNIFPTPATTDIYIHTIHAVRGATLDIYTITGQLVRHMKDVDIIGTLRVPVNELSPAVYFLSIQLRNGNRVVKKIVITK